MQSNTSNATTTQTVVITIEGNQKEVIGVEVENEGHKHILVNLHNTPYTVLLRGNDPGTGRARQLYVEIPPSGYQVKIEYSRQSTTCVLPIRAFAVAASGLNNPLPDPKNGVTFIVSPETRAYLTDKNSEHDDVWSVYGVQTVQIGASTYRCATALAQ